MIKALHDAGVPFALGSDAPQFWNVPGFSAHRELRSIVDAGLTPYQALRTGTANVGVYFKTESTTGTIAAGKRADLVLLDANPLQNIDNSLKIAGVMVNGRWMSKAEIDKRLAEGILSGPEPSSSYAALGWDRADAARVAGIRLATSATRVSVMTTAANVSGS